MKKIILSAIIFLLSSNMVLSAHLYPEKYYQTEWCGKWNGKQEYKLKDNTRVDCLTANYAVEFDFAPKWAESIGQALYYGKMTKKHPAVILIIEKPSDWKYYHRLNAIAQDYKITVWYMKSPDYNNKNKNVPSNKSFEENINLVYSYFKDILSNFY